MIFPAAAAPLSPARPERWLWRGTALLAVCVLATYAGVGWFSAGYDDEFYNIQAIERAQSLADLARLIDRYDVHPPLSYVANALLHDLTGSWHAVRALTGLGVAACLIDFLQAATGGDPRLLAPCLLLSGLHPTLVMWTTSLRWTGPFTAFLLLPLALILRNPARPRLFWGGLAALLVLLFHTNYEALLLGPLLAALALHARRQRLRAEWKLALAALVIAALLCVPQLMAMLAHQLGRRGSQTGTLLASLSGAAQGILVNIGLFPLSVAGVANMAAVAGLAALAAWTGRGAVLRQPLVLFCLSGTALFILGGLAVKPRNFTPLIPVMFLLLTVLPLQTAPRACPSHEGNASKQGDSGRLALPLPALPLLGLLAACQMLGLLHVIQHRDTGKGSWNLPVAAVLEAVRQRAEACPGMLHVAVYDVVLTHWLKSDAALRTVSPYSALQPPLQPGDCLIALTTYHGSMSAPWVRQMVQSLPAAPMETMRFAPDPYADLKRRFDPDIPDAYVQLLDFGQPADPVDLRPWQRQGPRP